MQRSESMYYEDLCFPVPAGEQAKYLALADKYLGMRDDEQPEQEQSERTPGRLLSFPGCGEKRRSKLNAA
jgi:hypothetical protein